MKKIFTLLLLACVATLFTACEKPSAFRYEPQFETVRNAVSSNGELFEVKRNNAYSVTFLTTQLIIPTPTGSVTERNAYEVGKNGVTEITQITEKWGTVKLVDDKVLVEIAENITEESRYIEITITSAPQVTDGKTFYRGLITVTQDAMLK